MTTPSHPPQCSRCEAPMVDGFIVDHGESNWRYQAKWVPGPPQRSWLSLLRTKGAMPITTWRCSSCGLLESYAIPEGS